MSTRIVPATSQPKGKAYGVNWNNPITEGLIFLMDPHQQGVNLVDGVVPAQSNGATFKDSGSYFAFQGELNGSEFLDYGDRYDGMPTLTVLALAKNRKDAIAATGLESIISKSGSGDDPYQVLWGQDENYHFSVDTTDNNTSDAISDIIIDGLSAGQTPADQWNVLGGTYDGSTVLARINKVKGSGSAATGSVAPETLNSFTIGLGGTATWDGWIATGAVWERALSDDEWNSLVDNPWQLFLVEEGPEEPVITFRKPWTKQPPAGTEIDWSNPLAVGLMSAFNFQPGPVRDLVTGKLIDVYTYTGGTAAPNNASATIDVPIYKSCAGGVGIDMATRASGTVWPWLRNTTGIFDLGGTSEYSRVLGIADFDSSGSGNPGLWRSDDNSLGNDFDIVGATNDDWWLYVNGVTKHMSQLDSISLGPYQVHGLRYGDGDTQTYIDGKWAASSTNAAASFGTGTVYNLGCQHVINKNIGGTWTHFMVWDRKLSAEEIRKLTVNPWQIFKPQTIMVPAGDAAKRRVVTF